MTQRRSFLWGALGAIGALISTALPLSAISDPSKPEHKLWEIAGQTFFPEYGEDGSLMFSILCFEIIKAGPRNTLRAWRVQPLSIHEGTDLSFTHRTKPFEIEDGGNMGPFLKWENIRTGEQS